VACLFQSPSRKSLLKIGFLLDTNPVALADYARYG
jgi:hypothetical protein